MRHRIARSIAVLCWVAPVLLAGTSSLPAAEEPTGRGAIGITMHPSVGGVQILSVIPGTPAADAKLQSGDVILSIDGKGVKTPEDVAGVVEPLKPGGNVRLEVDRQGLVGSVSVIVASRSDVERAQRAFAAPLKDASIVRAERFELVDSQGRILATIAPTEGGKVAIYDQSGKLQWTFADDTQSGTTPDSSGRTVARRYSYYRGAELPKREAVIVNPPAEPVNLESIDPEGPGPHRFYRR